MISAGSYLYKEKNAKVDNFSYFPHMLISRILSSAGEIRKQNGDKSNQPLSRSGIERASPSTLSFSPRQGPSVVKTELHSRDLVVILLHANKQG